MKKTLWTILLTVCLTPLLYAETIRIADRGEAASRIVIDPAAPVPVHFAARELQNYFRLISGARVSIMNGLPAGKQTAVVLALTGSELAKPVETPELKKQLEGSDGYAVRVKPHQLYLIADCPRGLINGVHRLIFKHTDFVWVRPLKEMSVYTEDPNLTLKVEDHLDLPAFKVRFMGGNANICLNHEEYEMFLSRLCNNTANTVRAEARTRRAEHAFRMEFGGGHNLAHLWLPLKKYAKTHPEYYMMIKGERRTQGRVQLCYTNLEMRKEFIKNALEVIRTMPSYYTCVNMMIEDTPLCCECPECMKPIALPDGKVLKPADEAFRSTQFYLFLNDVAAAVHAKYPKLEIKTFGYFFTAVPPAVPIHPAVCVNFCPYVRNDKETIFGKTNAKWLRRTKEYAAMTPNLIWREYYFCYGCYFPRAIANISAVDLRFINKLGVRRMYVAAGIADKSNSMTKFNCTENEVFSMTGAEFWTVNQLMWDPAQDPDQLRNEYLRRTYREAAPGVIRFFTIIRDSWLKDPIPAAYNDDYRRNMGYYIISKNLKQPCLDALAEAAKTVRDPRSKQHLEMLTSTFTRWLKLAEVGKPDQRKVPKTDLRSVPSFKFDTGPEWKNAGKLPPFQIMGKPGVRSPELTGVRLMHNGETLYVGFRCRIPSPPDAKKVLQPGEFPRGDHAEIFIADPKAGYYQLVFNCWGARYDACVTDASWTAPWEVRTQVKDTEWRAVVAIPFKSVGIVPQENNRVKALFFRTRPGRKPGEPAVHATWNAGKVHSVDSFGELIFDLE